MQQPNPNKQIENIVSQFRLQYSNSYLKLVNELNKLSFSLILINKDLDMLFANHAFNQTFNKHNNNQFLNLKQLKNSQEIQQSLKNNGIKSFQFKLKVSDTTYSELFETFPIKLEIDKQSIYIIHQSASPSNQIEQENNPKLPNDQQQTTGKQSVSDDITAGKIKSELKEKEKKYSTLIENINTGIALHEIITDETGTPVDFVYLHVNKAYEELTLLKGKDIIGKRGKEVIPVLEQKWIDLYGEVALTGKSRHITGHSEYLDKYWDIKAYSPAPRQFAVALTDITEIKKSEIQIDRFFEQTNSLHLVSKPDGTIIRINKGWEYILGYKSSHLIGSKFFDLIHKDDLKKTHQEITKLSKGITTFYFENRYRCSNGTYKTLAWSANIEQKDQLIFASAHDVTDKKLLEKQNLSLIKSLENSLNGFNIINQNFEFSYVNKAYLNMWGYSSPEEVIGHTPIDHCYDPQHAFKIREIADKHGFYISDFLAKRKDGSTFDVRMYVRKEIDEDGNTIYPSTSIDISARRQALSALQESEEKFRAFIDKAADGVAIVNENAKVTFVNDAFCKLLNLKVTDILQKKAWDIIYSMSNRPGKDESYKAGIKQRIQQLLSHEDQIEVAKNSTSIIQNETGKVVEVIESVFVFSTSKGKNLGVFLRDITDIKKAEKEIQSAYELLSETEKIAKSGSWTYNPITGEGSWSKGSYILRKASPKLSGNRENHQRFMHPEDVDPYKRQFEENALSSENEFKQLYRLIDSEGNTKHIEAHYEIQRNEKREPVFITGIDKDITDLIDAQFELNKTKEEYKALSDASFECIFKSKEGICIGQNKTAEATFGYTLEEAIGKPEIDWIISEDKEIVKKKLKTQDTSPYRATALRKDGTTFPCEIQARSIEKNGEIIRFTVLRDISERVEAEKALLNSDERFKLAMNASRDGLYDWNLITNEVYYSPGWKKMLGYEDHELSNKLSTWEELTDSNGVKESFKRLDAHYKKETERFEVEFKMLHKDGHYVDILSRGNAVFNSVGEAIRLVGTHVDISELKKSQSLLEYQKRLTQQYLDVAGTMLLALDTRQNVVMINPKGCEILGYDLHEIIGKNWFDNFIPKRDIVQIKAIFEEIVQGNIEFSEYHENPVLTKGGEEKIIAWHNSFVKNEKGNITRLFSSGNDITNEITNKKALEVSERKFRQLFEESGDAVFILEKDVIVNCNKSGLKLFEYDSNRELIGKTPYDLSPELQKDHSQSRKKALEAILKAKTNATNRFEWIHETKTGKEFPSEVLLTYIGNNEKGNDMTHAVIRNISYRKQKEKDIIAAKEKAEESDRLKSAFLANMSHEIRTPMNGILGFAELLKEPQLEEEEIKQYVEVIERSGKRMLNIINDLIDISKIEAKQMEVIKADTDINKQLMYLKTFFEPEAKKKNIELITYTPLSNKESQTYSDREKIYAILTNLIKNAVKYTHEGKIEFGYKMKNENFEFYVSDTGIGIPPDKQPNIFERFIQADMAHNKEFEGAGLGLAIAKAYVQMLGGEIWIEKSDTKGTEFRFTIPKTNK